MTYFPDLSAYRYKPGHQPMLNVGWLEKGQDFQRGPVTYEFATALRKLAESPVSLCRGYHVCDLCMPPAKEYQGIWEMLRRGNGEVHVRGVSGTTYAAPTLIWHYVAEHQYVPPQEFIDAVLGGASSKIPNAWVDGAHGLVDRVVAYLGLV